MLKNYATISILVTILVWKCCSIRTIEAAASDAIESDNFTDALLAHILSQTNGSSNFLIAPQVVLQLYRQLQAPSDEANYVNDDVASHEEENKKYEKEEKFHVSTAQPLKVVYTLYADDSNNSKQLLELRRTLRNFNLTFVNISRSIREEQKQIATHEPADETPAERTIVHQLHAQVTANERWAYNFQSRETRKELFYNPPHRQIYLDALHKEDMFPYAALPHLNASAVQLAMQGKENNMKLLILLPNQQTDLQQVLQALTPNTTQVVNEIVEQHLKVTSVRMLMPKFRLESQINLNKILMALSNTTNFSDLLYAHALNITQEASLEVHEDGIGVFEHRTVLFWNTYSSLITPRVEFNMKQPFVFIVHQQGRIQLFGFLRQFCCATNF